MSGKESPGYPLARRNGVLALLPFAEIVGVPVSDPEGLIVIPYREMPLVCWIKKWAPGPSLFRDNTVELIWRVNGVESVADSRVFNRADYLAAPDPFSLSVPRNFMLYFDAVIELLYRVKEPGSPDVDSPFRTLRVDRNPPTFQLPSDGPRFVDPSIAATGITEQVLADNPCIEIELPAFVARAKGDRISIYLSNVTPPFPLIHTVIKTLNFTDEPLIICVDRDHFRALPNGTAYMAGRAYDRSGNFSPLTASTSFPVSLIPSPSGLLAAVIRPPAYLDSLLTRDDARAGIAAQIPAPQYPGFMTGDEVVMIWNGQRVLPPLRITGFPFSVPIPWSILRQPGPLVREQVPVQYEIHRPGRPTPFLSPIDFFWQDWTIAGQDHAGAPAKLNLTLAKVQVIGNGSGLINELDQRDRVLGASVWVRLYVDPKPGEVLALYYGNRGPLAYYTVQTGDAFDQLVRFVPDLSGTDIVAEGNHAALPVFYTTSNRVNEQQAPETLVNVHVDPLFDLDAPVIAHSLHGGAKLLTCESRPATCHGVRWTIPIDSRMLVDDEVRLFWQGYKVINWEQPILGTEFEGRETIKDEHLVSKSVPMVVLPWDTKIEPMRRFASATAEYYLYRNGVLIGHSSMGKVRIDRVFPNSEEPCQPGDHGFCDGSDVQWLEAPERSPSGQLGKLNELIDKLIKLLQDFKTFK